MSSLTIAGPVACIDMYKPVESLKAIAADLVEKEGLGSFKSAILPVAIGFENRQV